MNTNKAKKIPDSPMKEIKSLSIAWLVVILGLTITFISIEHSSNWPSWASDLLLALIAGLLSGPFVGLAIWLFDKFALENIHQKAAHQGAIIIINQSTLFLCYLSAWRHKQGKSEIKQELQKCLMIKDPDATINLCMQYIQILKNIKITGKKTKELTEYVREHLDFLEKTHNAYNNSFTRYGYCGYLLTQHSKLHEILLVFENSMIPSRANNKGLIITKPLIIEEAFKIYLDRLEQFLKQAQIEIKKK